MGLDIGPEAIERFGGVIREADFGSDAETARREAPQALASVLEKDLLLGDANGPAKELVDAAMREAERVRQDA